MADAPSVALAASKAADETLEAARYRFERLAGAAKVILVSVLFVVLAMRYSGSPRSVALITTNGVTLLAFGSMLLAITRLGRAPRAVLFGSVAFEYIVITMPLITAAMWPEEIGGHWLRLPELGMLYLGTVLVGLRVDRQLAGLGVSVYTLTLLGLIGHAAAVDLPHWPRDFIYGSMGQVTAVLLGLIISNAGRELVEESAGRAVEAERARQRLGVYVSEEIADLVLNTSSVRLGGDRRDVAVLFCDLRGFTAYSQTRRPEELVDELNEYLESMVACIRAEGGIVDKYIGDAVMAVFGIPAVSGDEALRAVRAAVAMNEALVGHNAARAEAGLPPLQHGIGVHYGPAVAGNIGTAERLQYTVIGDAVNLASRLESLTKQLDSAIVVSSEAAVVVGDALELRRAGSWEIRGRAEPVEVYVPA